MAMSYSTPVVESRGKARASSFGIDFVRLCNNCYYMKTTELKVARIGNSRGVRLPAKSLAKYGIGTVVLMEERVEGILLRPHGPQVEKLSWSATAQAMSADREDWKAWDSAAADGLETVPWKSTPEKIAAEPAARYITRQTRKDAL